MQEFDSRPDAWEHIHVVRGYINAFVGRLLGRAQDHDASKLVAPERQALDEIVPRLKATPFGSPAYWEQMEENGAIVRQHYRENSHHPEHYEDGIAGMDLLDLVEMLADWAAATRRHANGDIRRSLEINVARYGIEPQLEAILRNTIERMGWQ